MIIIDDDMNEIEQLQEYLSSEFEIKDLGGLNYFLGIEVARSQEGIHLSQRKYVLDHLSETGSWHANRQIQPLCRIITMQFIKTKSQLTRSDIRG